MEPVPDIAAIAALLSNPARASMAWALIDGSAQAAGRLAEHAGVSAPSASRHLAVMLDAGLLAVQAEGRSRLYRIANSEVACMIESMAALAAELQADHAFLARLPRAHAEQFVQARTCYDHFAGRFGVALLRGFTAAGWLQPEQSEYRLTPAGENGFAGFGVDLAAARSQCRVFARPCADISERSPHLGGALAAAFLDACVGRGLVLRSRHSRIVNVSPAGWDALRGAGLIH